MKYLLFATAILIITSCSNASSSSAAGDAVFSYNLDGTKISGGEVDALMMNNAGFLTQSSGSDKKLSFFLNDAYKGDAETYPHSLRFAIPAKTGTTTLIADQDNYSVQLFVASGPQGKYTMYANEGFSITVTSISAVRVSGTFSGKVKLLEGTGAGKGEFTIADGKFDIPVRPVK
ncbi:MAG TPA: hypothetical protein VHD83_26390 [Puia sp.]|nr:hypothetical protein [Puia sp.]